jgi:hypothetical protein
VATIGDAAFRDTKPAEVVILNSVTTIGRHAFRHTHITGVTIGVTIGATVVTIGDAAFSGIKLNGELAVVDCVSKIGVSACRGHQSPVSPSALES